MAFIPDDAIDKMNDLSAGAWRLYCYLARCRNQKTGRCCPSVETTAEAIDTHPKNIFKLRKELTEAGWARFDGNEASDLLGFESSRNTTTDIPAIEVTPESRKNTTVKPASSKNTTIGSKNTTAESQKHYPLVVKTLPNGSENTTAYKEEPAKEPANRTSKDKARQSVVPPSVAYVRHLTNRYPDKTLWPRIVTTLGEDFDEGRLTDCYENWVSHGWNKMNLVWLFEWYSKGIPQQNRNGHAKPSLAERNQAAFDEAARQLGIYDNVIEGEVL